MSVSLEPCLVSVEFMAAMRADEMQLLPRVGIGTQIGTGRQRTRRDWVARDDLPASQSPQKTGLTGIRWDAPGRLSTHFETAPIDRSGTSPSMGCLIGATTGPRNTTAENLHQGIGWWHQIAR